MRRDRWHELDVQSHERDDGATIRYMGLDGGRRTVGADET